jgi:hypothetical protein
MKKTIKSLVFGQSVGVSLLMAAAILLTAAFACESGGDKVPPDNELQSLVKETTADFANAIDTEDFSKLHSKASTDFQSTYTVDQTKTAFESFIDKKDVVLPSLKNSAGTTATFSTPPSIRSEKGLNILVTKGEFPSKPFPVKFEYEYVWRDGGWKMLKLVINM